MSGEVRGKIATVISDSQIAINKGSADGVTDGAAVILYRKVEIEDPDTKENLGSVRIPRINFKVSLVSDRYCLATITDYETSEVSSSSTILVSALSAPRKRKRITDNPADKGKLQVRVGNDISIWLPETPEEPPF